MRNKDWKNWTEALPVEDGAEEKRKPVTRPRPGHADLAGAIKYNFQDARYILERASARETTARVAVGAIAKAFLAEFGIGVLSHVIQVGDVRLERNAEWQRCGTVRARRRSFIAGRARGFAIFCVRSLLTSIRYPNEFSDLRNLGSGPCLLSFARSCLVQRT